MPNKYLDSVQLARLVTKIKSLVSTTVAGYLPLTGGSVTGNLSVSGTITGDVTGTASGNLPLSGGTMTGNINYGEKVAQFSKYNNNSTINIVGSSTDSGIGILSKRGSFNDTFLILSSGDQSTNPRFRLLAGDGTTSKELVGKPDGTLTWGGLDITPQTSTTSNTSSDVSVPSATTKNLLSFSLTKGTWLVQCVASFPSNATGYRRIMISESSTGGNMDRYSIITVPAASGTPTQLPLTTIINVSSTTTFYLNVQQNSGSALNTSGGVRRFRLSAKV